MDPFSGVAAAIALAAQVAGTIQTIQKLVRDVKNAPKELLVVVDTLKSLCYTLNCVEGIFELRASSEHLPSSYTSVLKALACCCERVRTLQDVTDTLMAGACRHHYLRKSLGSLKIVSKREELRTLQSQLQDAVICLQLAISINSAGVQYGIEMKSSKQGANNLQTLSHDAHSNGCKANVKSATRGAWSAGTEHLSQKSRTHNVFYSFK